MIDPEKERESFISIRDLVSLIASGTGKTEQGAASMLLASIAKDSQWSRLELHEWRPSYGCVALEENGKRINEAIRRLQKWAETGNDNPGWEAFDDDLPF